MHWLDRIFVVCALLISLPAFSATVLMDSGELSGATDIDVGGTYYDVVFLTGTCADVYGTCDSLTGFTFQTALEAEAASLALLDQVFMNITGFTFDDDPELTKGCTDEVECVAWTAYQVDGTGDLDAALAFNKWNIINEDWDSTGSGSIFSGAIATTSFQDDRLWAKWTVSAVQPPPPAPATVPLPAAFGLYGFAFLLLPLLRLRAR